MDIHLSPRQKAVIDFALEYLGANIDDVQEMLEECPSDRVGREITLREVLDIRATFNPEILLQE